MANAKYDAQHSYKNQENLTKTSSVPIGKTKEEMWCGGKIRRYYHSSIKL